MIDTSGQKCSELFDCAGQLGLLQKMCQELYPTLTPSLKVWKNKVTTGGRILYRLVQPAHRIKGSDYGLLPTPTATDARAGAIIGKNDTFKLTSTGTLRRYTQNGNNSSLSLGRLLTLKIGLCLLPTPTAQNALKERRIMLPSPSDPNGRSLPQRLSHMTPDLIGKKINPQFLEWMMGYPKDWTEINP